MSKTNTKKKSLPSLISELEAITDKIVENDGVVDDETDALHDELHDDIEEKVAAYSALYKAKRQKAKALEEVIKHYKSRLKSLNKTLDWLKETAHRAMATIGTDALDTDVGAVRIQEASRRSIEVHVDAEDLPEGLKRMSVRPDKRAIREMMDAGEVERIDIDGEPIATLKPATRFIRFY